MIASDSRELTDCERLERAARAARADGIDGKTPGGGAAWCPCMRTPCQWKTQTYRTRSAGRPERRLPRMAGPEKNRRIGRARRGGVMRRCPATPFPDEPYPRVERVSCLVRGPGRGGHGRDVVIRRQQGKFPMIRGR